MSYTNAQIVLNSRDATSGSYNNSQYNAQSSTGGQNIIQGDIREIAVSEVNFPYDIPNVQQGITDTFELAAVDTGQVLTVVVAAGFYTGGELADAINAAIAEAAGNASPPIDVADAPTVVYTETSNIFNFDAPVNPSPGNPTPTWDIYSAYTFPAGYDQSTNSLGKDLLSIMGFLPSQGIGVPKNYVSSDAELFNPFFVAAASAPLVFTQYIDICSDKLTSNQMFQGGSTTNLARRQNVICRLFIDNNISIPTGGVNGSIDGTRPFVLNRQYYNARIMKWSTENSIPTIDIQLYDDVGQPLKTSWQPRPYAITFNAYERSQGSYGGNDSDSDDGKKIKKYRSYQEKNTSRAWANLAKQ
jgi:hypothetical protein